MSKAVVFNSFVGVVLVLAEMLSYFTLFYHIWVHDNKLASKILDKKVIAKRNRTNAINLLGLFSTWLFDIAYIICVGLLFFVVTDQNHVRDYVGVFKSYEYLLIPLIQIKTSASLKRFVNKMS